MHQQDQHIRLAAKERLRGPGTQDLGNRMRLSQVQAGTQKYRAVLLRRRLRRRQPRPQQPPQPPLTDGAARVQPASRFQECN